VQRGVCRNTYKARDIHQSSTVPKLLCSTVWVNPKWQNTMHESYDHKSETARKVIVRKVPEVQSNA